MKEKKTFTVEIQVDRIESRKVSIEDFIKLEFRGKNPDDYEFRADGKIVRKDRWENAIHDIRGKLIDAGLLPDTENFDIQDVTDAVHLLTSNQGTHDRNFNEVK